MQKCKRITIITRRENEVKLMKVMKDRGIKEANSTYTEGCGIEEGVLKYVEDGKDMVMLIPKVKLELVVDEKVERECIDVAVEICRTGMVGDGKIFIEDCIYKEEDEWQR